MSAPRQLLTLRQAAAALGVQYEWLCRHRAALEAKGFPARLPVLNLYDPYAIGAWMDLSLPKSTAVAGKVELALELEAARALLDERAAASIPNASH